MGADRARSPVVALGMQVQMMLLMARHARVRDADRLALMRLALRHFSDDPAVCAAVLDFEDLLARDVPAAADRLEVFLQEFTARRCPPPVPARHPWQERADLR